MRLRLPFERLWSALAITAVAVGLAAAGQPARAQSNLDTLVVAVPSDIQNLDPTLSSGDVVTQEMLTNVYSWLVDYKVTKGEDGTLTADPNSFVGDIAESFAWNEAGTEITFKIRDGLKFSNGDPLTAEAVKFTYDRIFDQGGVTAALTKMAGVSDKDHVKMVDESTIVMTVDTPNTLLLGNMAQFGHSILNPNVVKPHMTEADPYAHEWLKTHTEGTEQGPYKLASWQPGNQWVLERNEHYWGEKPKLERIVFKVIPDASSRLAQLISGAVDVAYNLPLIDIARLEETEGVTVHRNTTRTVAYLGMNSDVAPFDNKLVRQAVAYAIPYDVVIEQVMNGFAIQLTSPIPDGTPTHTGEFFAYENDPAKAKELLAEAGFPNGIQATLQIPSGLQEAKELAVYAQQTLAAAGIRINIQEMPGAAFTEQMQKHTLGFFVANPWTSINNDPFYHLFWLFASSCCNYANYKNEDVAKLIQENMLSRDEEARNAAALEIQKQIVEDAPWVFLYQPDQIVSTRSNVDGYVFYSADRYIRFKDMSKQ